MYGEHMGVFGSPYSDSPALASYRSGLSVTPGLYSGYPCGRPDLAILDSHVGYRPLLWGPYQQQPRTRKGGQVRFSNDQTEDLEKKFKSQKYLSSPERKKWAKALELSERQIKTWFQNRRAKWRRLKQDNPNTADDKEDDKKERRGSHSADDRPFEDASDDGQDSLDSLDSGMDDKNPGCEADIAND